MQGDENEVGGGIYACVSKHYRHWGANGRADRDEGATVQRAGTAEG